MFLLLASRLPAATTWTKCVGELGDREDALAVEPLAIFLRYAGQQTEFVLSPRLRAAPSLELALTAMSVQHEVWWQIAGQECRDVLDSFSNLTDQGRSLHLQRGVAIAVYDLAHVYLASDRFRQQEGIEREQQFVFFCKFVGEFETIGDELGRPAVGFGGYPLNSLQGGLHAARCPTRIDSKAPCHVLNVLRNGRPGRADALRKTDEQAFDPVLEVNLILRARPLRISIPGSWFGARAEPALGRAIQVILKELGTDVHSGRTLGRGKVCSILAFPGTMSIHTDMTWGEVR